ncbi:MAG: hypothetical protein ACE5H1_06435, partial [Thermodesulfobacteriota bacterium]
MNKPDESKLYEFFNEFVKREMRKQPWRPLPKDKSEDETRNKKIIYEIRVTKVDEEPTEMLKSQEGVIYIG